MKIIVCQFLKRCGKVFGECPCPVGKVVFDKPVDAVVCLHDSDAISVCPVLIPNVEDKV